MLDPQVVTVFGLDRDALMMYAAIAGGLAVTATVLAMLVVSVLPAYSESWAERLGASTDLDSAPKPADEIPGFDEPVTPGGEGEDAARAEEALEADDAEAGTADHEGAPADEEPAN